MGLVKLTGTTNPHENWTSEYILEKDENGEPTKVVRLGEPIDLTKEDREKLEGAGAVFSSSSKEEAKEYAERQAASPVGSDITGAAPMLGAPSSEPNQAREQPDTDQS